MKNFYKNSPIIASQFIFQHESVNQPNQVPTVTTEDIQNMDETAKHNFALNIEQNKTPENMIIALQNIYDFNEYHQNMILKGQLTPDQVNTALSNISTFPEESQVFLLNHITNREQLESALAQFDQMPPQSQIICLSKKIEVPTKKLENLNNQYLALYGDYGYTSQEASNAKNQKTDATFLFNQNDEDEYGVSTTTGLTGIPDTDPRNPGGTLIVRFRSATPKGSKNSREFIQIQQMNKDGQYLSTTNYIAQNNQIVMVRGENKTKKEYNRNTRRYEEKITFDVSPVTPFSGLKNLLSDTMIRQGLEVSAKRMESAVQGPRLAHQEEKQNNRNHENNLHNEEVNRAESELKKEMEELFPDEKEKK